MRLNIDGEGTLTNLAADRAIDTRSADLKQLNSALTPIRSSAPATPNIGNSREMVFA
ncbi:MAG: hypothetical protein KME17_28065 [Cyanosarcina radialis HA8281-LM2]|nr:hypothetical protein [Cyanosarcina radialis HA8281-LM2]